MRLCLKLIALSLFLISCAQEVNQNYERHAAIYGFSLAGEREDQYQSCNEFSDETFRGYVWSHSSSPDKSSCVSMEIIEYPHELLKNESLFLQIYPFSIEWGKMRYGESLPVNTLTRDQEELILSNMIDAYLVEIKLKLETDYFFEDHIFELCDIGDEWAGLHLVVYERRPNQQAPAPIRTTKFLLPPFLAHPGHFRDVKGDGLAAFHPFLAYAAQPQSASKSYYDLAEEMCQSVL